MLADIQTGTINTILVCKVDRITRSLIDFYHILNVFEQNNIDLVSLEENFDTSTPVGRAIIKVLLVFAELEREQIGARTQSAMIHRAEQGLWNVQRPLGYNLVDKKLVVNKQEAELVKLIFTKYLELGSLGKITDWLNKAGFRTTASKSRNGNTRGGQSYYKNKILYLLRNTVYIGKVKYRGNTYPGQHAPIIPNELFDLVQTHLDSHTPNRTRTTTLPGSHVYTLQGIAVCTHCGNALTPRLGTGRNGIPYPYYVCSTRNRVGNNVTPCPVRYVPAEQLEHVVEEQLRRLATHDKLVDEIVKQTNENSNARLAQLRGESQALENRAQPIRAEIDGLVTALSHGLKVSRSVKDRLLGLESQLETVQGEIEKSRLAISEVEKHSFSATILKDSLARFVHVMDKALPEEKKALLRLLLRKVTFSPSEIGLHLYDAPITSELQKKVAATLKDSLQGFAATFYLVAQSSHITNRPNSKPEATYRFPIHLSTTKNGLKIQPQPAPPGMEGASKITRAQLARIEPAKPPRQTLAERSAQFRGLLQANPGWTKSDLARHLGISPQRVHQILGALA